MNNNMSKYYLMEKAMRRGPMPVKAHLSNTRYLNPCYQANNKCYSVKTDDTDSRVYFSSEAGTYTRSGERNSVSYR